MAREYPTVVGLVLGQDNGCDFWRTMVPFVHLKQAGFDVWTAYYGNALVHHPDVLVCNRAGIPSDRHAEAFVRALHAHGTAIVVDQDDDNRIIPLESPNHGEASDKERGIRALRIADLVTCTTDYLARRFRAENDHVAVLPNLIDPDLWAGLQVKPEGRLTIGTRGGTSHYRDWDLLPDLFRRLAARYPHVDFLLAGYAPDWYPALKAELGSRLRSTEWERSTDYQRTVAQIDIGLCVVPDTEFNRCKSPIQWIEYATCRTPAVVSPTVYGSVVRDGKTALVANSAEEWYSQVVRLVEDRTLYHHIAEAAERDVLAHHSIHSTSKLRERMDVYRAVWQRIRGKRTLWPVASSADQWPAAGLLRRPISA